MKTKITPNLWFDDNAEEAAEFYISVFKNGSVLDVLRYTEAGPGEPGTVVTVKWEVNGQEFVGINGGPMFTFSEAVSFEIECEDQAEVDYFWDALTADGGEESHCGWCKDRFGLSWQVVPKQLLGLLSDPDPGRALRATNAMYAMKKIDLATIVAAANGS